MSIQNIIAGCYFYVHTLYSVFHRAVLVVCKLSLVSFCFFDIFPIFTEKFK